MPPERPQFAVAGIPVHVSIGHLLTMAVIFYPLLGQKPALGIGVILLASVSVLAHELGHALVGLYFRLEPHIQLIAFGGLTHHRPARRPRDEFLITAAGPGVNFLFALLLYLVAPLTSGLLAGVLLYGTWINLIWGLYNLVPLYPLDGGRILMIATRKLVRGIRADRIVHTVGLVIAVLGVAYGLLHGEFWILLLTGLLGVQNWRMLQALGDHPLRHETEKHTGVRELLRRAHEAYESGDFDESWRLAHQARSEPHVSRDELARIWHMLALAAARKGEYADAIHFAERVPGSREMAQIQAVCVLALGDAVQARSFLGGAVAGLVAPAQVSALRGLAGVAVADQGPPLPELLD